MQPVRIGQFADSYPPIVNGVSTFVHEHHAALLAQDVPAYVFTFGYLRSQQPNVFRTAGVRLGTSPFHANVRLNGAAHAMAASMDLLHIHEPFGIGWLAGRAIARAQRLPYVFTVHTRHDLYIKNWPRAMQPWMQWQARCTMAGFIRDSALTSAPSEDSAEWLRHIAPASAEKIVVRHNGIDLNPFMAIRRSESGRARYQIPDDHCVFAYVGRLSPEKNLAVLLEVFTRALRGGAQATLLLIGDGPDRNRIEQTAQAHGIAANLRVVGDVARARIPALLACADVFVTTSQSEVNPVSVIEALAAGVPYLGLAAPWWREFSHLPAAGWLAAEPAQMAALLCEIAAQPNMRAAASQATRQVATRFDIRGISAGWAQLYQDVIIRTARDRSLARRFGAPRESDLNEYLQT
jgi:1,2-diacylglycerol 3-alpha-glucosyltransferase